MPSWINFLGKYSKKHNMKLGDAMKPASKEWKKMKKNGGNHCNQNPEDVLKNPTKTVLPNCTRKYRRHRKIESKKGGNVGDEPVGGVNSDVNEMGGELNKETEMGGEMEGGKRKNKTMKRKNKKSNK